MKNQSGPLSFHHSSIAQHYQKSRSDVARLVAMEHVRNKFSLRGSKHCKSFKLLIALICLQFLFWIAIIAINQINYTEKWIFFKN